MKKVEGVCLILVFTILQHPTGLFGPTNQSGHDQHRHQNVVDNKGKIKVEAEDNAIVVMDHGNGTSQCTMQFNL
jgi:hypothetical protein